MVDNAAPSKRSSALLALVVVLIIITLVAVVASAMVSGSGVSIASVGPTSVTFSMKAAVDNSYSPGGGVGVATGVFLTKANFRLYGNGIFLSNGTVDNFFPSQGSNSTATVAVTVPYSGVEALIWSSIVHGGSIKYGLKGTATFLSQIGQVELPLNINTTSGTSLVPIGPSPGPSKISVTVFNDPLVGVFQNATIQVYSNGDRLTNSTSINSLPGGNTIPNYSTVTTEFEFPYASAVSFLGKYAVHAGAANLSSNILAKFESFTEVGGSQLTVEIDLPIYAAVVVGSYLVPVALLATLVLISGVGFLLRRKGYL